MKLLMLQIGAWRSWEEEGLSINDIVWPGNEHVAPPGVPEKFHLKVNTVCRTFPISIIFKAR